MVEQLLDDEARYRLLRLLADYPELSQRELAHERAISLGKVNYYCLNNLLDRGYVKAVNFKNSRNKRAYLYHLTAAGISRQGGCAPALFDP